MATGAVREKERPNGTEEGEDNESENREGEIEEKQKDIEMVKRAPINADDLYNLLSTKGIEEPFAGKRVADCICYKNTFSEMYKKGINNGEAVLVVLKKYPPELIPNDLAEFLGKRYIFACEEGNKIMFFILPRSKSIFNKKIFDKNTHRFAVFAKWRRVIPDAPYYCCDTELVDRQISLVPN